MLENIKVSYVEPVSKNQCAICFDFDNDCDCVACRRARTHTATILDYEHGKCLIKLDYGKLAFVNVGDLKIKEKEKAND